MEDWDCDGKPNQANYAACQSKPGNETVTGKRSITSNKFLLSLVSNPIYHSPKLVYYISLWDSNWCENNNNLACFYSN